jgi:hypothetical protein
MRKVVRSEMEIAGFSRSFDHSRLAATIEHSHRRPTSPGTITARAPAVQLLGKLTNAFRLAAVSSAHLLSIGKKIDASNRFDDI